MLVENKMISNLLIFTLTLIIIISEKKNQKTIKGLL